MRFYPQLLLWTYVLLPAISLLLAPTFIIALARAQQQRARVVANALAATVALARNQHRRCIPNNRYTNGFGPNIPFRFRSKREVDVGTSDIAPQRDEQPKDIENFARKTHWDQQEESLSQLQNMWNMNNFGSPQNNDIMMAVHNDEPEKSLEAVGNPHLHGNKKHGNNNGKSEYSGAFFGRNVFDDVLEQSGPVPIGQTENDPPIIEETLGAPEPTFKKKKKKKFDDDDHEPYHYPQNHYNYYYYPQPYYASSYYSPHYRTVDIDEMPQDVPMPDHTEGEIVGAEPLSEERSANPEPTFKKKKKKDFDEEEHEAYPQIHNYYIAYYPQKAYPNYYPNSYSSSYYRSAEFEDMPQNKPIEADNMGGVAVSAPSFAEETLGNPEPTFKKKKKKKKFDDDHEHNHYPQNHYNYYYYTQPSYASSYYSPHYRTVDIDDMASDGLMTGDMDEPIIGEPLLQDMEPKAADPVPTFKKKKKKKFGKRHQMDYGYSYPQNYHSSYSSPHYYPYGRDSQQMPQDKAEQEMDDFMLGELESPRFANPEPTFKEKGKDKIEHMPPSFYYPPHQYNYYDSPSDYSNGNYNPYARSTEIEEVDQSNVVGISAVDGQELGEAEQKSANPEFRHNHKKIETKQGNADNFFYSSNFYDRGNEDGAKKGDAKDANKFIQESNTNLQNQSNQKEQAEFNQKAVDKPKNPSNKSSNFIENSEKVGTTQLNEQVQDHSEDVGCGLEEKIEEKLEKKIKKMFKEQDKYKPQNSYPPMYHPPPPPPMYHHPSPPPMYHHPSSPPMYHQPSPHYAYYRSALETDKTAKEGKQEVDPQRTVEDPVITPTNTFAHDVKPQTDFADDRPRANEKNANFNQQIGTQNIPTSNQKTNIAPQNTDNSRRSLHMNGIHNHPEDVGCELDDDLFESSRHAQPFDPYSYYQRAVEEISEQNKKLAKATQELLHPHDLNAKQQPLTPFKIKPPKPAAHVNFDDIPKNDFPYKEQFRFNLESSDRAKPSTALEEKSADPHHHSHGFGHTHSHFHSHTHGHGHQKSQQATPQIQINPTNHQSQVFPHQQGFSNGGFSQAEAKAQTFNHGGMQNSFAHANSKSFGNSFVPNAASAQSEAKAFSNGGFGQSTASASSTAQNGGQMFGPNAAFGQSGFNNGGFGQSVSQATAQAGSGFNGVQNFGNGFNDPQGFGFSNNPGQFARSLANSQIVGQPHLDETPIKDFLSEMESDMRRSSRSSPDFQGAFSGLRLASSIVDTSLNKNSFLNRKKGKELEEEPEEEKNTMDFVTNIVDSSLKAGEANIQRDTISKISSPESADSESPKHLTLQGLTSITDLVSRGLRNKRQIMDEDYSDFADKHHKTFSHESHNIVSAQDANNYGVSKDITNLKPTPIINKDKILRTQNPDEVLQISDETNDNKNVDGHRVMVKASVGENETSENSRGRPRDEEETILGMVDPDSLIPTPEIITNEPWASNWDYKNKRVIPIRSESKNVFTKKNFNSLEFNNTSKASNFKDVNPDTTSENLAKVVPALYNQQLNTFPVLESPKKRLLTYQVTDKPNVGITEYDDVFSHISNSTRSKSTQSYTETSTESPDILHTASKKEENDPNIAREDSFLGLQQFRDGVAPILPERNEDIKTLNAENARLENGGSDREILPHLFYEAPKNVSSLTSDEIQDLQFDLPNNSTEDKIATRPEHKNKGTEKIILGLPLQDETISDTEQEDDILGSTRDNINKKVEGTSLNKHQGDPSHMPQMTPSPTHHLQNDSIRRIIFNISGGPFASIEAEMGVLTEEEKEAFIRQEVDLISEVIAETLKNRESMFKEHNKAEHIKNDTKDEATEKASIVKSPNIFQVFGRDSGHPEYSREARSAASNEKQFNDLLDQHKEKVEKIKKTADEDDDLLMISFIGHSVIQDLEHRRNQSDHANQTNHVNHFNQSNEGIEAVHRLNHINHTNAVDETVLFHYNTTDGTSPNRTKREINSIRSSRAPLTQLITDPTTKLDVGKTLQNIGSIARHTFENPRAPMYHVRNMLGNAKNSVMSAARVPPNNFLIPSKYEIAKIQRNKELNEKLGAINQKMLLSRSGFKDTKTGKQIEEPGSPTNGDPFGFEDTVQKIGGLVRDSVQSGKDAVAHVNDVAADAKKFLHTTKYATPRFIVPRTKPMLTSRGSYTPFLGSSILETSPPDVSPLNKKTVLITPRIFDVQEHIVGAPQETPENFIGMEHILDATGVSQPNQPEVELEKIEFEPLNRKPFKSTKMMSNSATNSGMKGNLEKKTNDPNTLLGSQRSNNVPSLNLRQDSEHAEVTESLKDFMQRVHDEMKEIVRSQYEERKRKRKQRTEQLRNPNNNNRKEFKKSTRQTAPTANNNQILTPNMLGATFSNNYDENGEISVQPDLMNIFSERTRGNLKQNFMRESEEEIEKHLVLPTVHSRIQQESINNYEPQNRNVYVPVSNYADQYPYQTHIMRQNEDFEQQSSNSKTTANPNEAERVAALLPPELMKPFMGQASETLFHEYMRENGDLEESSSDDSKENHDSEKLVAAAKSPITPPTPNIPQLKPFSFPSSSTTDIKPDVVGAAIPGTTTAKESSTKSSDIAQNTQEFVELLSDPEIDGSGIFESNKSGYLSSNVTNEVTKGPNLEPNNSREGLPKPKQKNVVYSSTDKSFDLSTGFDANKNLQTIKSPTVKDGEAEKSNDNTSEDIKQSPSFSTYKKNPLSMGHVPDENDLGYVLGAINPMMFERHFNERLKINDTSSQDTHNKFVHHGITKDGTNGSTMDSTAEQGHLTKNQFNKRKLQVEEKSNNQTSVKEDKEYEDIVKAKEKQLNENLNQDENSNQQDKEVVGAENPQQPNNQQEHESDDKGDANKINSQERLSMDITYKEPFLGYVAKDEINTFLNQYNNNLPKGDDDEKPVNEYTPLENYQENDVEPVKNVVFPSLVEDEADYNYAF